MDQGLAGAVDALARKRDSVVWCWSVLDWEQGLDPWRGRAARWKGLWGGYTSGGAVNLAPNECAVLKLLRTASEPVREWRNPEGLAWSVYVLAHESVHVAGERSEKKATCWGLQRVGKTALELGRTQADARYLADLAWREAYRRNPAGYRSRECRDGGRLDLNPKSHAWP